jgi:hypothetical protein
MAVANLANIPLHIKVQAGLGTPATGTGASGIEVRPSQGLAMQVASIESQMIQTTRMRKRPRQGSRLSNTAYETELTVGSLDTVIEAVLGGTWAAAQALDESDWGTLTITGSGVTLTFGTGSILTDGVRAGMWARLTNMSEAANNSVWFPILETTETVMTIPSGILVDNASDAAWDIEIAKTVYTADPYTDRYFTVEEYLTDIDRSKLGTDMKFNTLNFSAQPDQHVTIGFGLVGRDLELLDTGDSPTFTDPVFIGGPSLTLLDGGIYVNGALRANLTGFTFGLTAPAQGLPVLDSVTSPDIFLGQFALAGQFTGAVEDGTDFDAFDAETQMSVVLHCAEQGGTASDFISFFLPDLAFGGWGTGIGGEGALIQTIPLYGGLDERGEASGYAPTSVLVSTSAA